jgi:hypothetical protein
MRLYKGLERAWDVADTVVATEACLDYMTGMREIAARICEYGDFI